MTTLSRRHRNISEQINTAQRLRTIFEHGAGAVAVTIGPVHAAGLTNDTSDVRAGAGLVVLFAAAVRQQQRMRELERDELYTRAPYKKDVEIESNLV